MPSEQPRPSPITRLRPELIDEIINLVYILTPECQRHHCLANCALACRAFLWRSQGHLFSHIVLPARPGSRQMMMGDYPSRLSSLLEILEKNPSLAEHIQELDLILPRGDPSWMNHNLDLWTVMQKINSSPVPLQKLQLITTSSMSSLKIPDPASYLQLVNFFERMIAPFITTLRIEFIADIPPELLTMCTNLRNLTLMFITLRKPREPLTSSAPPTILHLEFNVVDNPPSLSTIFNDDSLFDFSLLRSLTTYADDTVQNLDLTQRIVDCAQGSLESVVVQMSPRDEILSVPSTYLNLDEQPSLHTFTHIAFFRTPTTDGLSDTCLTLKTIDTTRLRKFHLIMCVNPEAEELLRRADWAPFVREVLRICSHADTTRRKLVLFFDMHYFAPSEHRQKPWEGRDIGPKGYAEEVLDRLIEGRLLLLENCARIHLDRRVTVIEYQEEY